MALDLKSTHLQNIIRTSQFRPINMATHILNYATIVNQPRRNELIQFVHQCSVVCTISLFIKAYWKANVNKMHFLRLRVILLNTGFDVSAEEAFRDCRELCFLSTSRIVNGNVLEASFSQCGITVDETGMAPVMLYLVFRCDVRIARKSGAFNLTVIVDDFKKYWEFPNFDIRISFVRISGYFPSEFGEIPYIFS